jgi:hypothetical protein
MSEMLANHYFMIRDFAKAVNTYESLNIKPGISKAIRKKMIICYVRTFQIEKALAEFCRLVEEDITFISKTDLKADDCPCPEIISEIENDEIHFVTPQKDLVMGILWLYCDHKISLKYLDDYLKTNPNDSEVNKACQIIKTYYQNSN